MDFIYSRVMPHMNRTVPLDTATNEIARSQFYWKEKLENIGYTHTNSDDTHIDYKMIYNTLRTYDFSVDKAYVEMCKLGNTSEVLFLRQYTTQPTDLQCVNETLSTEITKVIRLYGSDQQEAIRSAKNNSTKLKQLLQMYDYDEVLAEYLLLYGTSTGSVVASSVPDSMVPSLAPLATTHEAGVIFEKRGYVYDVDKAIVLSLSASLKKWLSNEQSDINIKLILTKAIKVHSVVCVKLIVDWILTENLDINLVPMFIYACKVSGHNSKEMCSIFLELGINTDKPLTEAIKANNLDIIVLLVHTAETHHLRLAISMSRSHIYNILRKR